MSAPIIGDFITLGKTVLKTAQKLRQGKASAERLKRLDERLSSLETSLVACRESNSGFDITKQGRDVMNGVADMSLALGCCEEAIVRFRRDMEQYKNLTTAREKNRFERVKELFVTGGKWLNFNKDLELAIGRFEQDLQLNMILYEMTGKRISRYVAILVVQHWDLR